ncbi:MAG: hypothetical protein MR552_02880 [Clostridiales bacterium]|nr:hypothetical protein [Clostridiales bacterium]
MTDFQTVSMVYNDRFYSDPLIRSLYRRVADGKATYAEVQTFAQRASVICSEVLMDYAPEADFAEWARELVTPSLTQMHGLIDDVAQQVQTHLNRVAELSIKAQSVPVDAERIGGIASALEAAEDTAQAESMLRRTSENYARHVGDEAVRRNAAFQSRAGLKPTIRRTSAAKCCAWCAEVAGTYDYADVSQQGDNVWRRHLDCRCLITYIAPGRTETVLNYRRRES